MGSSCSSCGDRIHRFRTYCSRKGKKLFTKRNNQIMVTHVEVLIQALKLGPLKVKVRRQKHNNTDNEIPDENETVSNLDVVSGVGTAGDARTLVDQEVAQEIEDLSTFSVANEEVNPTNFRKSKREKSIVTIAGKVVDKIRGEGKTIDLFNFKLGKKSSTMKARTMFAHAMDCHQAVIMLQAKIETLLDQAAKAPAKLKISENLVVPGTKFKGKISIPAQSFTEETVMDPDNPPPNPLQNLDPSFEDIAQDQVRPYEMTITREMIDEAGNKIYFGRHQTYDGRRDKQTILMHFVEDSKDTLHYEDYETHCDGIVSNETGVLEGGVKQMQKDRVGFFVNARGVKHTFLLERCDDSRFEKVNALQNKLYLAKFARALAFAGWCGVASNSTVTNEKFVGYAVDWSEIIEDMVWICDEVGSTMRRYVQLLDGLKFANPAERKKVLGDLENCGIRRGAVHEVWDAANMLLPRLRDNIPVGSCHTSTSLGAANNFAEKILHRLNPIYERFDKALRRVDKRVCEEFKTSMLKTYKESEMASQIDMKSFSSSQRDNDTKFDDLIPISRARTKKAAAKSEADESVQQEEVICTICTMPFEAGEVMYLTPCKHTFHLDCLDEWFKMDGVCPICRKDFSQSED